MKPAMTRASKARLGLCALTALAVSSQADAGLLFRTQSSTLTLTHDLNTSSAADVPLVRSIAPVPAASTIYPSSGYQINRIATSGASTSQVAGSLGHVTNASTGSFLLATGTGVAQDDPGNLLGPSSLKFDVDLRWSVTSGGLGPVSTGFASINTAVKVGTGGRADLKINLQFLDGNGAELRSPWRLDAWWDDPGTFTNSFTTSNILGQGTLIEGQTLRIKGTIEFLANNEGSPTSILPVSVETGFTPPTATFTGEGETNWSDQKNWQKPEPGNPGLRHIANGVGDRARFLESNGPRKIKVDKRVSLGTLDVDGNNPLEFIDDGKGGRLVFQTNTKNPGVLNVRNSRAKNPGLEVGVPGGTPADTIINSAIELDASVDIEQDSAGKLDLSGKITGKGGLTKRGRGLTNLNANNDFLGDVTIEGGKVNANAFKSLGNGSVKVRGGQLGYNANGAAKNVLIESGLLDLGVVPNTQDKFEVRGRASIKGSPAELSGLFAGGNITLEEDAFILHDEDGTGDPVGLGTVPRYIYGVAGNLPNTVATVGQESSSPWKSFGAQAGTSSIGTATTGALNIIGNTELIVEEFGVLRINALTTGTGSPGSLIRKTGFGIVALQNNSTAMLPIRVEQGTLFVNGYLPADVTVEGGMTLGGVGEIAGAVSLLPPDSILAPGSPVGTLTNDQPVFAGTLTVNSLALANLTLLEFDLGTVSDKVRVNGDLTLDGVLMLAALDGFGPGQYTLFEYTGTLDDQMLQFGVVPAGFDYSYQVGSGLVTLTVAVPAAPAFAVPEPGTLGLLALGTAALLRRRRPTR